MSKSLILTILDYCGIVWTSCNKADIERLELLQRWQFQSLENRCNTHILGLVKRCLKNKVPQFLKIYFKLNKEVISRLTRSSNFICFKNWYYPEKLFL